MASLWKHNFRFSWKCKERLETNEPDKLGHPFEFQFMNKVKV